MAWETTWSLNGPPLISGAVVIRTITSDSELDRDALFAWLIEDA